MNPVENIGAGCHIIRGYQEDSKYRASFNRLAQQVFGISFDDWYQMGCWDDRYIPYSIVYQGDIIANLSASRLDLTQGVKCIQAIQIGTVMTHPDFRRKGLSRRLMDHVLKRYEEECGLFFLMANRTAADFYPQFGFTPVAETRFWLDAAELPIRQGSLRKLAVTEREEREWIQNFVDSRQAVSRMFGVECNQGIFMFHAVGMFRDCLYWLEEEQAIAVFEQEGDTLHLYDVVSRSAPCLDAVLPRIIGPVTRTVELHFTPDHTGLKIHSSPLDRDGDQLFVKPAAPLEQTPFRVPTTALA